MPATIGNRSGRRDRDIVIEQIIQLNGLILPPRCGRQNVPNQELIASGWSRKRSPMGHATPQSLIPCDQLDKPSSSSVLMLPNLFLVGGSRAGPDRDDEIDIGSCQQGLPAAQSVSWISTS